MAMRIDGKAISAQIRQEIAEECRAFVEKTGYAPGLAVIIVGENPASQVYVRNKKKACEEVGFYSEVHELPEATTQEELNALVDALNGNDKIHGILVQLPLPRHLDENGAYILDISTLSGNIKILMTGAGKVWNCGSINVSRDEDGAVIVSTLTDYVDQITRCVEKIESIERSITYINEVIRELRKKLDLVDKQYELI
jgi:hypothetical protein